MYHSKVMLILLLIELFTGFTSRQNNKQTAGMSSSVIAPDAESFGTPPCV